MLLGARRRGLRERNVAAQVAEGLKTVTYATPPREERRKKRRRERKRYVGRQPQQDWAGLHDNVPADLLPRGQKVRQSRATQPR